jgi:hypothetical protein
MPVDRHLPNIVFAYIVYCVPLYVANPKISSYNNQGARTKNWLRRIVVKVVMS